MKVILMIILILIVMYTGLSIYFEYRLQKLNDKFKTKLNNYESKAKSKRASD